MGGKHCIKVWTITYKEISLLPTYSAYKILIDVADNTKKIPPPICGFLALSPTALTIFKRTRRQRLHFFSVLAYSV
jgi:hypothetical protein